MTDCMRYYMLVYSHELLRNHCNSLIIEGVINCSTDPRFTIRIIFQIFAGLVEEAVLPYSDAVSSEQTTVEEMRELVCVQERRPPLADQWSMDEVCTQYWGR